MNMILKILILLIKFLRILDFDIGQFFLKLVKNVSYLKIAVSFTVNLKSILRKKTKKL